MGFRETYVRVLARAGTLLVLSSAAAPLAAGAQTDEPVFPEEHADFLGGGSHAALFGHDEDPLPAPSPSSPTGTGRPPRVGPNERVNDLQQPFPNGLLGRSETTVAATDDGQLVAAGFNDARGFLRPPFRTINPLPGVPGISGFGFSSDGGLSWIDGGAPPVIDHIVTRGDPWLDRGGLDGTTFYYSNLAIDDRLPAAQFTLGVSVHRGHFSGGTLSWEDVHLLQAPNYPRDFYDKEAIAGAKDGTGAAYVSLTNFIELCNRRAAGFGRIEVWRTHDGGTTWQGPVIASPDRTDAADPTCRTGVLQQNSVPAIGPGGEMYVVWQLGPTFGSAGLSTDAAIMIARSLDGGASFDAPVKVADINSMRRNPPVGYNRPTINDHPRIAVATSGRNKGRIYVVFYSAVSPVTAAATQQSVTSSQAFVSFSDDRGLTWSTPAPVAPAVPATGVKRFWPVVSVEPGGNVNVVYDESQETQVAPDPTVIGCDVPIGPGLRRTGNVSSLVDTFWVESLDGGINFRPPVKVSTVTSNWCTTFSNIRPNFGDYIGSLSGGNRILSSWADGRSGAPDTFFAAILGAGKSP